ncbi:hypothetical protein BT63DRAFT_154132 [Microthyrium microscopicum]|uniref:Uncharacterized protein n=1 Tax=Microthyrium microscopicum TaxID=703497 RepID=A0A6A6UM62_9PEZI|nr:hypothetical protein BT63DRAFT_154132 [Microthyrium microscopicum]
MIYAINIRSDVQKPEFPMPNDDTPDPNAITRATYGLIGGAVQSPNAALQSTKNAAPLHMLPQNLRRLSDGLNAAAQIPAAIIPARLAWDAVAAQPLPSNESTSASASIAGPYHREYSPPPFLSVQTNLQPSGQDSPIAPNSPRSLFVQPARPVMSRRSSISDGPFNGTASLNQWPPSIVDPDLRPTPTRSTRHANPWASTPTGHITTSVPESKTVRYKCIDCDHPNIIPVPIQHRSLVCKECGGRKFLKEQSKAIRYMTCN